MNDDLVRRSYERHLNDVSPRERSECATPEELLALVEREGGDAKRMATLDHAMACAACRRDLELLRAVTRAGTRVPNAEGRWAGVRRMGAPPRRLAAAAVLVIALGSLAVATLRPGSEPAWRGAAPGATPVSPMGELPLGEPVAFVWRRVPAAAFYELELLGPAGEALHTARITDTILTLPSDVLLTVGVYYSWVVRARMEDGTTDRSDPVRFRLVQK